VAKITDKTLIPIGLAVIVIGGAAAWVTQISLVQSAHGTILNELKSTTDDRLNRLFEILTSIDRRLLTIEVSLKIKPRKEPENGYGERQSGGP
jgi:hypothetical protein